MSTGGTLATYAHMCRMDHEEIGFNTDSETCPLCIANARVAELGEEKSTGYASGRFHACALLSAQVYDSYGESLGLDDLLALCDYVAEELLGPSYKND